MLGDLGLAAFLPEGSDFVLGRSGTPGFLAPECYENLGATKRGMGWGCVDRWMGGWIWMAGWKLTGGGVILFFFGTYSASREEAAQQT